jgi:uncharacterized DUF497 family protein
MDVECGKAAANLEKHAVPFEEAATSLRLISARRATRKEASFYA